MGLARARYLGIAKETEWGTPVAPTTFLEFLTCGVKKSVEKIQSAANINQRYINDIYPGSIDIGGPFDIEVNPDNIGLLLFMALGVEGNPSQVVTTQAEITDVTCEADVAGSLSGKYWLLNSPSTEYYVWYDVNGKGSQDPAISGKTGIVVGIAPDATASAVASATQAAIDAKADFGATVNAAVVTITNAAAGAVADASDGDTGWTNAWSVTQQGSGGAAYDHDFTPADDAVDLGSFTLEVGKAIKQMRYAGCRVNSLTLSAAKGSILKVTFNVLGKSEDDTVSAASPTYSTKLAYVFDLGQVKIDGGAVAYVKSFDLTIDNMINADGYMLDGSNARGSLEKQGLAVTGTMTLEYTATSYAQRTAYMSNAAKQLTLIFTSSEQIEAGYYYTLTVDMPAVKYIDEGDDVGGRDAIPLTIGWAAKKPAASSIVKATLRDAQTTKWSA